MQKQNPIDDLFRSELADYKVGPSDERRAAFMREAGEKPGKRLWSLWWLIGIVGLVFIGIGVAVLVRDEKREVRVDRSLALARYERDGKSVNNTKVIGKANENAANKKNNIRESINKTTSTQGNKNELIASANQMPALGGAAIIPLGGTATMAAAVEPAPQAAEEVGEVLDVKGIGEPAETKQPPEPAVIPGAPKDEQNKSTVKPETQNEEKEATYRDNSHLPKKWNISTGVYYTPEWMFNTLNGDKFVNNFGVEGTFHFGRYSVRTGFGLSVTKGSNEMVRQTNSYLGAYNALDSITFAWDGKHTSLVPTYYTKNQSVYDTTLSYNYYYNKKRYTYLQVPLVLGYDFWQNSWLSLGIRGGAVMSLLLKSENLSESYDPGKDRIITINNVSPDRIQLNWQAMGGINANFRLSRRFSFEVEPDVRYYFNSVYESSELTKKPWSLGVRAAFVITILKIQH